MGAARKTKRLVEGRKADSIYQTGRSPGFLQESAAPEPVDSFLTYTEYDAAGFRKRKNIGLDNLNHLLDPSFVSWLDVQTTGSLPILKQLGQTLGIHPLVLEDIQDLNLRPKMEDMDHYIFVSLQLFKKNDGAYISKQISLIMGERYAVTIQEEGEDAFAFLRQRLEQESVRIHKMGADYLAYLLIDAVVDSYFPVVEAFSDESEELFDLLVNSFDEALLNRIHHLRQSLAVVRKELAPLNDIALRLRKADSDLISARAAPFFADIADHTLQNLDNLSYYRESAADLMNLYHSVSNTRMNLVMKTLTVVSTVFIPLTFIVGVYGMNFSWMPELEQPWGYPAVMAFMGLLSIAILRFLKKKKWV